jgi:8-oxo-dGTP diphosphatase
MNKVPDIRKAGGVLIKDRHFLVTRARGKDVFVAPGGKPEDGESIKQALVRELMEEVQISALEEDLEHIGTFTAQAAGNESKTVEMAVWLVNNYEGEPSPSSEIEEAIWVNSQTTGVNLGSIFEHEVIPYLLERKLID